MNHPYVLEELETIIAPTSVGESCSGALCFSIDVSIEIVIWYYT